MRKFAKIIDETTKFCSVGVGNDTESYKEMGFVEMDVEEAWNGDWYVKGYAPEQVVTKEEQRENRANAYKEEVDPITSHIQRLRDEEQTEEVIAEIESLVDERTAKVEEIKQRYPYPEEESNNSDSVLSEDESEVI